MTKDSVKTALEAKGAVKVTYADPKTNAGAGVGAEPVDVTVLSRNGGDIEVNENPGFDGTTQFTLGRFVRGISRVFPKD